jgi:hypothetical protein
MSDEEKEVYLILMGWEKSDSREKLFRNIKYSYEFYLDQAYFQETIGFMNNYQVF